MGNASSDLKSGHDVSQTLAEVMQVINASLRPLPTETGDGSYNPEPAPHTGVLKDVAHLNIGDVETITDLVKQYAGGGPVDDKTYLMERVIQVASDLPLNSSNGIKLTDAFRSQLWNDLNHPPASYLGDDSRFRHADGSGNNIMWPRVGAANMPYARTVEPKTMQPARLPDPGVLFDALLARKTFKPHPTKISSVLFYLASIIIHDLFHTDHKDFNISKTSSYLDLSPLYGSTQAEQDTMRTFEDGKLKKDCFASKRILGFPPGVGALLIAFNRMHNFVVQQLATVNEADRFLKPSQTDTKALADYDNTLFQTGRLVTCGLYINIILKDYVRTILNLNRTNSLWDLDPRPTIGKKSRDVASPGVGNAVSVEFNLVYRWHSCLSERDEAWVQHAYAKLFPGQDPAKMTLGEIMRALGSWEAGLPADPATRPFADLRRNSAGSFSDNDLANILTDSIEDCAGSFGARHVPTVMRALEVLGIQQARSWNVCSLNELRTRFGLTPHKTFEDINSDPVIADQLKHLYDHPDFVELYPGVVVEEAKKAMVPGSGLCTSFTISRAILSDAVSLVRSDRFYTTDYTPKNLTNWGFNAVNYDLTVDQGCVFYKLLLRAFPHNFKPDSIYVHYPMVIPSENRVIMKDLGRLGEYNWETPEPLPQPIMINSYAACKLIMGNKIDFRVTWGEAIEHIMHDSTHRYGVDFMLSGDCPINLKSREMMKNALYTSEWQRDIKDFYEDITLKLLHQYSYKVAGVDQVDIVRDIGNLAQVHFAAGVFSLPLKTESNPHGIYAEPEMYMVMAIVFIAIFFDADPVKSFPVRAAARKVTQQLGRLMLPQVEAISKARSIANLFTGKHPTLPHYGVHMMQRLLKSGLSPSEILFSHLLPTAGGMVANQAQLFALCVDYYLSEEGCIHLPEINRLAKLGTPAADEALLHYFMEGTRINASVGVYRDAAKDSTLYDNGKEVSVSAGCRLMCDLVTASKDASVFPQPEKVDLKRDMRSYIHYGYGPHQCLGYEMSQLGLTTMLKTIGRLDGLRRAPGPQGQIKKVMAPGGFVVCMTADEANFFPFPQTLKVQWDGGIPTKGTGSEGLDGDFVHV